MNKHSVALILPYYGRLPEYFPLWLKSSGANSSFTFMIFTDIDMTCFKMPGNVLVHYLTFEDMKKLIAEHLDCDFVLDSPYKLCDYRPIYGLIFQEYLNGYDFWGHCDCDLIWGDLGKYITDDMLDKYGKLFRYGHLVLYRNTESIRKFALHELPGWEMSYRNIYSTETPLYFDESAFTRKLFATFADVNKCYDAKNFADMTPFCREFRDFRAMSEAIPAFRWHDGKIYALHSDGQESECMYVHFQKRRMKFIAGLEDKKSFLILNDGFVEDHELTANEITCLISPEPKYEFAMREKYKNNPGWQEEPEKTLYQRVKTFFLREIVRIFIRLKVILVAQVNKIFTSSCEC